MMKVSHDSVAFVFLCLVYMLDITLVLCVVLLVSYIYVSFNCGLNIVNFYLARNY